MNDVCNGSCSASCKNENSTANKYVCDCEAKTVSPMDEPIPIGPARTLKSCPQYHPRSDIPCIMHDLCHRRDIPECPVRTGYCQLIGESDTAYAIYKAMHECTPSNEARIRGMA